MNITTLRATKEYIASVPDTGNERFRFIVNKLSKDVNGNVVKINITFVDSFHRTAEYKTDDFDFYDIVEPVNATEFFTMYSNWMNFFKDGIHQDLVFAEEISTRILNSLKVRSYVKEGAGKFESFDYARIDNFITLTNKKALN